jgi:aminoglycoside phosphotransferase family enzyme
VCYPYLDCSTLQKREWACRRAVMLNHRTAPTLYIGVVAVLRQANGSLAIGGERNDDQSEVLELAIKMRQFAQEALFDNMVRQKGLSFSLCRRLAQKIATFQQPVDAPRYSLPPDHADGQKDGLQNEQYRVAEGNINALRSRPNLLHRPQLPPWSGHWRNSFESPIPYWRNARPRVSNRTSMAT